MERPPPISLDNAGELYGSEGLLASIEAVEEKLSKFKGDYQALRMDLEEFTVEEECLNIIRKFKKFQTLLLCKYVFPKIFSLKTSSSNLNVT